MKKFKMSTSIIIIVISVAIIVGFFFWLTNFFTKDTVEEDTEISVAQEILLRNMDNNYPPTPKEVVKYYSEITQCLHSGECTDKEIEALADRALVLLDAELLANQDKDTYIKNLKSEITSYEEKDWTIDSFSTSPSTDVVEFKRDGDEWAQLYAFYVIRQSDSVVTSTHQFLLRRDEDGRWKIFGWQFVS